MADRYSLHLVLFLTRGVPLAAWDASGSFSRETALYRRLAQRGVRISIVSWGGAGDLAFAKMLPGMTICCNRRGLPNPVYEALLPWLHRKVLREADLVKTNQTDGADLALACARRYRKPLIARCGYMWSKFRKLEFSAGSPQIERSLAIESRVFSFADRIVVTTPEMLRDIVDRFPDRAERATMIPNYVDTDLFSPAEDARENRERPRLVFIGRLTRQKGLNLLIAAISGMDIKLELVGRGPDEKALLSIAAADPRILISRQIPNEDLPERIRRATIYVQPSLYEGHPKTIIEAMACGACVLATDVDGIREVVRHRETGWLTGTEPEQIRAGLDRLLADPDLRARLGAAARRFAVEHYSLDRILEQEAALYATLRPGFKLR